jgi:hypothetical protein
MNLKQPMPLAALRLGFDPVELMAKMKAKGVIRARAPLNLRVLGRKNAITIPRPELKGLKGAAYHRAYRKLQYLETKLHQNNHTKGNP